jgi:hypothetical protein
MTGTDFFFVTIIAKHLLAHVSQTEQVLTRAGGRLEAVASLSQGRTAAAQCALFTHKSVPVIFEPPCTISEYKKQLHVSASKSGHHQVVHGTEED